MRIKIDLKECFERSARYFKPVAGSVRECVVGGLEDFLEGGYFISELEKRLLRFNVDGLRKGEGFSRNLVERSTKLMNEISRNVVLLQSVKVGAPKRLPRNPETGDLMKSIQKLGAGIVKGCGGDEGKEINVVLRLLLLRDCVLRCASKPKFVSNRHVWEESLEKGCQSVCRFVNRLNDSDSSLICRRYDFYESSEEVLAKEVLMRAEEAIRSADEDRDSVVGAVLKLEFLPGVGWRVHAIVFMHPSSFLEGWHERFMPGFDVFGEAINQAWIDGRNDVWVVSLAGVPYYFGTMGTLSACGKALLNDLRGRFAVDRYAPFRVPDPVRLVRLQRLRKACAISLRLNPGQELRHGG